ncbi:DUF2264 domain-containing protein [Agromyces sp. ISL-38]|uniref:DUF2264 domain-containing protein n=1 Tax=Agromyces sp. ISL-38 TaxID=2819107 RepID=UPI001BEC6533|nr:DUF2264 domain-containing protein [Agromyces sp. ISL-38]MBT2497921.1 DUF2264 domain-containing protein [Agromyces sp. ISL-38]
MLPNHPALSEPADPRSPLTGLGRAHWAELADHMLRSVRPYASPGGALIQLPGPPSHSGRHSDGLEGFARTMLLAAFRLRGERGDGGLAQRLADGIRAGVDPSAPDAWPLPDAVPQARVEAASIALSLWLTEPWLWDELDDRTRERVLAWLARSAASFHHANNWVWFRIVVSTFLRRHGGSASGEQLEADLAFHETLVRADGWMSDGEERAYDHYNCWALHFYPLLWARMAGEACEHGRRRRYAERLADALPRLLALIGADGTPLLQGRSLIYRFAPAAPLWLAATLDEEELDPARRASLPDPGMLRRAASGMLGSFLRRGAPDERGLLTQGLGQSWPAMSQSYSGPGSPYWAVKGMAGLMLPADHPVWTAREAELLVERGPQRDVIEAAGWELVSAPADGIVRVTNHGTDHALPGEQRSDSPWYARLAYSTATVPPVSAASWDRPLDNAVVLVDGVGRGSHRTGFERLPTQGRARLSRARAHWMLDRDDDYDAGHPRRGTALLGPWVTVASIVHGVDELRLICVDEASDGVPLARLGLECSGWPIDDAAEPSARATAHGIEAVTAAGLRSGLQLVAGPLEPGLRRLRDVSPLGPRTAVPLARAVPGSLADGAVIGVLVSLRGDRERAARPTLTVGDRDSVSVAWPDDTVVDTVVFEVPAHRF